MVSAYQLLCNVDLDCYYSFTHHSKPLMIKSLISLEFERISLSWGSVKFLHTMAGPPPLVVPALKKHTATVIFVHGLGDNGSGW